jgi:hypothetical protein
MAAYGTAVSYEVAAPLPEQAESLYRVRGTQDPLARSEALSTTSWTGLLLQSLDRSVDDVCIIESVKVPENPRRKLPGRE